MKRATKIKLYNADGTLLKDFVGIANEANHDEVFNVASPIYQEIQHEEAIDAVKGAFDELNLKTNIKTIEKKNGARINMQVKFPDYVVDIGDNNDKVEMMASIDNSYDGSRGLNGIFGAFRFFCTNGLVSGEQASQFYHRHTKGINLDHLKFQMTKCIDHFENKFVKQMQQMVLEPLNPSQAMAFLEQWTEEKLLAAKYLEIAKDIVLNGGTDLHSQQSEITNKWIFYNIMTEVITHHIESADVKRKSGQVIFSRMTQ